MVSHGSHPPVHGKVSWGNKPSYGHLLPADVGDGKFQNERNRSVACLLAFARDYSVVADHALETVMVI
jgi:hypothetical protein